HNGIVAEFRALNFNCEARGADRPESEGEFLCFGRGDQRDIVSGGHKVVGSAQRRRRGAVLQHGSILISRSHHAPEFPGICDIAPGISIPDDLPRRLSARIAPLLAERAMETELSAAEVESAGKLQMERYANIDWQNRGRNFQ
ncbi:MAG: hypothetical protein AB7O26_16815, partial [Planctomycetaceae bacterium]